VKSNRLLVVFGSAIAALAIIATILVVTKGRESIELLPESNPAGIVQRYVMALQRGDYDGAAKYLSVTAYQPDKRIPPDVLTPPVPVWPQPPQIPPRQDVSWRAVLNDTTITGDTAQVNITVYVFRPGGPFSDPVRTNFVSFSLQKENGAWRIIYPVDLYWLY